MTLRNVLPLFSVDDVVNVRAGDAESPPDFALGQSRGNETANLPHIFVGELPRPRGRSARFNSVNHVSAAADVFEIAQPIVSGVVVYVIDFGLVRRGIPYECHHHKTVDVHAPVREVKTTIPKPSNASKCGGPLAWTLDASMIRCEVPGASGNRSPFFAYGFDSHALPSKRWPWSGPHGVTSTVAGRFIVASGGVS